MINEPAFPFNEINTSTGHVYTQHFGATICDYFAAKVISEIYQRNYRHKTHCDSLADIQSASVKEAYEVANMMLKAREKD